MKINLTVLALILFTSFGFSQEEKETGKKETKIDTRYGIRGGMNVSNLDFKPEPLFDNEHRNGFYFGGFSEFSFSETMFLNVELQWSAQGGKAQEIRADYINLPVQLKFNLSETLSVGVGPQIGLKTWKNKDGFETWVFSGVGSLEYMFTDDLFFDVRAVYGFSNILDDATNLEAKDFTIQFGIGMKI